MQNIQLFRAGTHSDDQLHHCYHFFALLIAYSFIFSEYYSFSLFGYKIREIARIAAYDVLSPGNDIILIKRKNSSWAILRQNRAIPALFAISAACSCWGDRCTLSRRRCSAALCAPAEVIAVDYMPPIYKMHKIKCRFYALLTNQKFFKIFCKNLLT